MYSTFLEHHNKAGDYYPPPKRIVPTSKNQKSKVNGKPFLDSWYSRDNSEAESHPKRSNAPKQSSLRPCLIDVGTETPTDHWDEGWTEYDVDHCRYFPKYFPKYVRPLVSDPELTEPVIKTDLFADPAQRFSSLLYDTYPILPPQVEDELLPSRVYNIWTFFGLQNESKLHGSECVCVLCFKDVLVAMRGHLLSKDMRLGDGRRKRYNPPQLSNSLRAKHQQAPLRYYTRDVSMTSTNIAVDDKSFTDQPVSTALGQRRQGPVQPKPTLRTKEIDHNWEQGWKNLFRHIKTGRRHYKDPKEMYGSAFAAYCREIRRNHKVEYSLLSSLIAQYGPPRRRRARARLTCVTDFEPVDAADIGMCDNEVADTDNLVGSTLDGRILVLAFNGQDEHTKIYLTKSLSTDEYYEMRVYPFDEVRNKGKKSLWRDCQKRRRSRKFLDVLKHEGKSLLLFHLKRITFGQKTYLLGSMNYAVEVERQSEKGNDREVQLHKLDRGLYNLGDVMEFPPLPTAREVATAPSRVQVPPKTQTQTYASLLRGDSPELIGHQTPTTPVSEPLQDIYINSCAPVVSPNLSLETSPSPQASLDDLVEQLSARIFTAQNLMRFLTQPKNDKVNAEYKGLSKPLAEMLETLVRTAAAAVDKDLDEGDEIPRPATLTTVSTTFSDSNATVEAETTSSQDNGKTARNQERKAKAREARRVKRQQQRRRTALEAQLHRQFQYPVHSQPGDVDAQLYSSTPLRSRPFSLYDSASILARGPGLTTFNPLAPEFVPRVSEIF